MPVLLLTFLFAAGALAAPADELAKSPVGVRVLDFITAFNSGDEPALRAWISANYSDSALLLSTPDRRMANFRQLKQDLYRVTLQRVLEIEPDRVATLLRTARDEWYRIDFVHEPAAPHQLHGLMVERSSAPADTVAPSRMSENAAIDSTQRLLAALLDADDFSGVVIVARHGKPILRTAQGYADREDRRRNRMDTKFNLGSISKAFTRVAIERLIADRKLLYETKVGEVLPDYPNQRARETVTVRHLLEHTSGIPDFFNEKFTAARKDSIRALKDYLPFFADEPLEFTPGEREHYSNGGYLVLGLIIEKLAGRSYHEHIDETLFGPLRMRDSGWWTPGERVRNRAIGYTRRTAGGGGGGSRQPNTETLPARGSSAGGGYATAEDLVRFADAIERGHITSGAFRGGVGLAGGAPGLNSVLESGIGGTYTVVVLSNYDPPAAERVAQRIRGWFEAIRR